MTVPWLTPLSVQAQSTWIGVTSNYNFDLNWIGNAPVSAGQSGLFTNSGSTSLLVTGTVAPDSWTFTNSSQNYLIGGGAANFGGAGIINSAHHEIITIGTDIGGTGGVAMHDTSGTLILSGNNSYSGTTTIDQGGNLQIVSGGASANSDYVVNGIFDLNGFNSTIHSLSDTGGGTGLVLSNPGAATLTISGNATTTYSGLIRDGLIGNLSLTINGGGSLTLTGNNSYSGTTTISAGTLQIGNGGTSGTLGTGNVVDNGALVFNRSDSLTLSDVIVGTGSLTQAGTGTVTLSGRNSYSGVTTINSGATLRAQTGNDLSPNSDHVVNGTLDLNDSTQTIGALAGSGLVTSLSAGAATLDINPSGISIFSGSITDGAGRLALRFDGPGTTILTGNNTYSSTTNINAGTLQVGNGGTSGTIGTGAVSNNAALVFNRADALLEDDNISGTGTLTQAGAGTLILTGNNSYGDTIVSTGILQIGNGGTSGSLGTGSIVNNGALVFNRSDTFTENDVISGNGTLTQAGSGTLTLSGRNSYSGVTTINSGATLRAGSSNDLSPNSNHIVNGTLDLNDSSETIGALAGSGIVTSLSTGTATLDINSSGTSVFSGSITDGAGRIVLQFDGPGTTILTGTNTYSGTTDLNAGILQIGNGGTSGTLGIGAISDNATLVFNHSDTVTVSNDVSGSGSLTQAGTGTTILTGSNSYSGATNINAGSTLALSGTGIIAASSAVNDAGTFDISAVSGPGTNITALNGTGSVNLGIKSLVITAGGSVFSGTFSGSGLIELAGGTTTFTGSIASDLAVDAGATLQAGNGGTGLVLLSGAVTNNGALVFNHGGTIAALGAISGAGTLTQSGGGTLILAGNNSYGGATTISSGVLLIGDGGTSGTLGAGDVIDDAGLAFDRGDTVTVSNAISGSGELVQAGSGNLILTGTSSYTGPTLVNSGTLSVNGAITTSPIIVNAGGKLGGTGAVANVTVNSGGIIAPGNSIGTLHVASLTLEPGATTAMQVSPADADHINVTGAASLQGALAVTHAGGAYNSTIYRLIQAGQVTGTFSSASGALPGFTNILRYSKTSVNFILVAPGVVEPPPDSELPPGSELPPVTELPPDPSLPPGTKPPSIIEPPSEGEPPGIEPPFEIEYDFGSYGMTQNQITVGNALSAGSPSGALYTAMGALVGSNVGAVPTALGQLAGDIRPSLRAAAIEDSRIIRNTLLDRMRGDGHGTRLWGAGFGGYGGIAGDGNAEALHHDLAGFLAGADFDVMPDLRLGLAAGYTASHARTGSRLSTADGDAGHIGAYADWRSGDFSLDAGGEYGFGTVRVARNIGPLGLASAGSQDQETGQLFADAGYRIALDSAVLEPHASLAHVIASSGSFAESGSVSALSGGSANDSQSYAILGVRGAIPGLKLDDMDLTPRLDVGWQHALMHFAPGQTVTLVNANQSFLVLGTPLARDAANVQAGFDLSLGAATLFVAYDGSFAATTESHGFRGGLNWQF